MPRPLLLSLLLLTVILAGCGPAADAPPPKPRVVVTTDPELDDSNSLIRYLLYSSDFQTEGLIYASSAFHWKGDGQGTPWFVPGREYTRFGLDVCPCTSWRWAEGDRFIHDAVELYQEVYDNLKIHHPGYPAPAELLSKIYVGNVEFDGDISKDTPGSDRIKALLLDENDAPLYLLAWGGQSTIARALKSIQETHETTPEWPALRERVSRKAIIQAFGDQDDTNETYIAPNWPEIAYREMSTQTYGYGARGAVLADDQVYLTAGWTAEYISSKGPLGAHYRVWGDGKQMVDGDIFDYFGFAGQTTEELRAQGYIVWLPVQEAGSWISEGDTPTFMNLLDNGLRGYENATHGGWGGREGVDLGPEGPNPQYASARFFGAAQRDLAARLVWSVTPSYAGANHEPAVMVDGPLNRTVPAGDTISLTGSATDPDGDAITIRWWQYAEAGSYPGSVPIANPTSPAATLTVPPDAEPGQTIHLILEATDAGGLSRYRRVVLTVGP